MAFDYLLDVSSEEEVSNIEECTETEFQIT